MITEILMLFSAAVSSYVGFRVFKGWRKTGKEDLVFLYLFLFAQAFAITMYVLRMVFIDSQVFLYTVGGFFHGFGFFSLFLFGLHKIWPRKKGLFSILGFPFLIFPYYLWQMVFRKSYQIHEIPAAPYEFLDPVRTEIVMEGAVKYLPYVFMLVFPVITVGMFFYYGLNTEGEKSKESFLYAVGFLVSMLAILLDAVALVPSLVFVWRLLYAVGAFIILEAYRK